MIVGRGVLEWSEWIKWWRGNSKFSDYRRADTVYVWNTKKVEWRERNEVKVDNFWCNAKATRPGLNIEYPGTKPAYFIFPFSFFFFKKKRRLIFEKVNSFFPLSQLYNSSFFPSHLFFSLNFLQSRRHCLEKSFPISIVNLSFSNFILI